MYLCKVATNHFLSYCKFTWFLHVLNIWFLVKVDSKKRDVHTKCMKCYLNSLLEHFVIMHILLYKNREMRCDCQSDILSPKVIWCWFKQLDARVSTMRKKYRLVGFEIIVHFVRLSRRSHCHNSSWFMLVPKINECPESEMGNVFE